ncbi:S-adenosyl-L-methionine-dependent methyltransferase [Mrakia frigida]|uniref:class I SAM-dependent methyltransferase n=1 Tax=Mrakia frigida TaxID=29902 RepID=UPI003FCC07E0
MSYYERSVDALDSFGHQLLSPPPSVDSAVEEGVDDDEYDLISLRSSQCSQYFDYDYDGRLLQNVNNTYLLPADSQEMDRLSAQHQMLFVRNSSLFVGPLDEALEEARVKNYGVPTVLDVGCGGGDWVIDLARQFPYAICLGTDIVPVQRSETYVPENCSFELVDVDLPLPWPENSFDIIHMRDINQGITNYDSLVARLCQILRPGGLILLAEPEITIWSAASDHEVPYVLELYWRTVRNALRRRGVDPDLPLHLYPALLRTGALQALHHDELGIPCSTYFTNATLQQTGELNSRCLDEFITSSKTLLLSTGMSRDEVALLQFQVRDELSKEDARFFQRWFHCWGRKPSW